MLATITRCSKRANRGFFVNHQKTGWELICVQGSKATINMHAFIMSNMTLAALCHRRLQINHLYYMIVVSLVSKQKIIIVEQLIIQYKANFQKHFACVQSSSSSCIISHTVTGTRKISAGGDTKLATMMKYNIETMMNLE